MWLIIRLTGRQREQQNRRVPVTQPGGADMKMCNPLAAINSVAVAIGRFTSVQEMLEYALDRVLEAVDTEAGGIYLLDEAQSVLTLVAHRGLPTAVISDIRRLRLGEGLSGRVALTGEPIILRNLKDDPRLIHHTAREEGLRGFASMPLRSNVKTYGTLNIHTRADREFSEEDVQLLASMASQIGLAVASARLFMDLQASERKFRSLVENAADLIYLTDRAGRIVYANSAWEQLLHHDPGVLCASRRSILSLVHPEDRDLVSRRLALMAAGQVVRALEFRMLSRDAGGFRWFSQTTVPIRDESGEVASLQCVAHDITERRTMQEQIADAERLADMGRMAAILAHEIRNPLGAIVNSINAMLRPHPAGDHRLHDIITEEAHRLDRIVSDFLLFARPAAGVPIMCSVAELIDTAVILFERSGRLQPRVRLRWTCPDDMPDIIADPNQIRQVLWNLIANAADATGREGEVDVVAHPSPDCQAVSISVTDDGPGVSNPADIFRPFFTTKANGTGLGLAVVGQIVRQHGGVIRVDNVESRGACITFTIPVDGRRPRSVAETA
jgi:two-component system, sporulation sensor kinase E